MPKFVRYLILRLAAYRIKSALAGLHSIALYNPTLLFTVVQAAHDLSAAKLKLEALRDEVYDR